MRKSAEEVGLRVMRQLAECFGITDHPDVFVDKQAASIVAAAIREDRAEPVSDEEVEAACRSMADGVLGVNFDEWANDAKQSYRKNTRAALEAARQARANADEKGDAR